MGKAGYKKRPRHQKPMKSRIFIDSGVKPLKSLTKKTTKKVIHSPPETRHFGGRLHGFGCPNKSMKTQ
jgi:hypothetical protein